MSLYIDLVVGVTIKILRFLFTQDDGFNNSEVRDL